LGVDFGADLAVDFGVLRSGALLSGAGAAGCDAGTSFSAGCAVESRFAIARSRFNVESAPRLSGPFFDSELQAPSSAAATSKDGPKRRVYFNMRIPPGVI
jgi:hypothetical protein